MLLGNNEYIGKLEWGPLKAEIYDTGKRTWLFKKVYAYQLFERNYLIQESLNLVLAKGEAFIDAILEDTNLLGPPERKALDYVAEFVPVEEL